jgi:hypothetical protein
MAKIWFEFAPDINQDAVSCPTSPIACFFATQWQHPRGDGSTESIQQVRVEPSIPLASHLCILRVLLNLASFVP